jgi:Archaeal Peptidase A24 C-terminal Domain
MSYLVLFTILVFGIWTSYTDIKKGVIKNYSILLLVLAAIILNIFFTKTFITNPVSSAVNIILAVVGGILLWLAGMWSAADAKLYIAFSFLLPIMFFPILVNSFVPLFIFFFFYVIAKTSIKEKREIAVELAKPKPVLSILIAVLALMSVSYIISHEFNISLNYFLTVIIFFAIFWLVEQKFKLKLNYFFLALIILSVLFFHNLILTTRFLLNWIISSLMILLVVFLVYLGKFVYTYPVKLTKLKEGMIPAEMILKKDGKYFKKPVAFLTVLTMLRERTAAKPVFGYNPDGIKDGDIKNIIKLYKGKKLNFDEIKICKTMHFAPFIFLGILITYFAGGYFTNLFL